jgi:hypothetical protein
MLTEKDPGKAGAWAYIVAAMLPIVLACLVAAPPALATHGGSHDPSPSGPDCEWYGSVEHAVQQNVDQPGYTSVVHEKGRGWSGPSDDSTCRGTVEFSYTQHETSGDELWWHREGEHTVGSDYEAGWANWGPPGTFAASFPGDEPMTIVTTNSSGSEPGEQESPGGSSAGCLIPNADTPAKRASIQAIVVTCSQIQDSNPNQSWTGTIRMRRTQCDTTIDTDGDDLADCTEFSLQTEPHNPDTDGDALADGEEVLTHGTDPRHPDSDDGGVEDGDEVALGTDPLDPTDDPETCNDGVSNDFDGLADFPADPGCSSPSDPSELGDNDCDNGADDDGDSKVDWPADDGCDDVSDLTEAVPDCNGADVLERHYTTISGVSSIGAAALPDPDFGTFDMGVRWCITPSGPAIDQANPTASLSGNWIVLGVLEVFGLQPYHTPGKASILGNRALGTSTFGLRMSAAGLLANFLPASKLLKVLDKAARRYDVAKRAQGQVVAARALLKRVKAALNKWGNKLENALRKKLAAVPGIPASFGREVAERVADEAEAKPDTVVEALDRQPARVILKKLLSKFDVPLWRVNAGIRVFSDGSYLFINTSSHLPLVEEWTHSTAD